jgi:lipopolysaccharide/colanic/teichoic acid biosynthesis glycosyltransferase
MAWLILMAARKSPVVTKRPAGEDMTGVVEQTKADAITDQLESRVQSARVQEWAKRLGDFVIAGALIAFTSPLMAIAAIAIKCDSPGPVFYREERVDTQDGRFSALKFRSTILIRDAEQEVRVTRVGRFLRYTRIGQLPQLINVLRGEMTCFGAGSDRPYFLD